MIPETNPYNNWSGNGSTTTFDFDFYIEDETQLAVYHTDADGVQTTLTFDVDYSINEVGNENGSYITFPLSGSSYDVLEDDEIISLCLTLPIAQENTFGKSSYLNLETLEYSLDYLTRILQIMNRYIERCVKIQEGSSDSAEAYFTELLEDMEEIIAAAKSEFESELEEFEETVNTTFADYKTEVDTEIAEFEEKINSTIDAVTEAAENINALEESVETAVQMASDAEESAAAASETLSELQSLYDSVSSDIENLADTSLTNLTDTGEKHFVNKMQITNCILEEPQMAVYEIDSGVSFTFKSGTTAIFPFGTSEPEKSIGDDLFDNGAWEITDIQWDGSNLFYWAEKINDDVVMTDYSGSGSAQTGEYILTATMGGSFYAPSKHASGGTEIPSDMTAGLFYNTDENRVYRVYSSSIETYEDYYYSLPLMTQYFESSTAPIYISSIFNGQGYIGSSRWVNKNVKVLIPDGLNEDGTLNNLEKTTDTLLIYTLSTSTTEATYNAFTLLRYDDTTDEFVNASHISTTRYFESDNLAECESSSSNAIVYRPRFNDIKWWNASEGVWYDRLYCLMGAMNYTLSDPSAINDFIPYSCASIVDRGTLNKTMACNSLYSTIYISGTSGYREWFFDEAKTIRVLLEQWGRVTTSSAAKTTVTLLKSFSNSNYSINVSQIRSSASDSAYPFFTSVSSSSFVVYGDSSATNIWYAIGK